MESNDDEIPESGMDVVLLPATNSTRDLTDEDYGDEDTPIIDNASASQLNAPAMVCSELSYSTSIPTSPTASTSTRSTDSSPVPNTSKPSTSRMAGPITSAFGPRVIKKLKTTPQISPLVKSITTVKKVHNWKKKPFPIPAAN